VSGLRVVWHEAYEVDIGPHVFPTAKYRMVRDRLLADRTVEETAVVRPESASDAELALVHTPAYLEKIRSDSLSPIERLQLEVPFTDELRVASWLGAGGSIVAGRLALRDGVAVHLGGGFHHAFPDHGEGFCLINDVAIAVRALQRDGAIRRSLIVDLDVHHGNGTAAIFAGDEAAFTFSMHQQNNYPAIKPPSDLDLGLEDGTGDDAYAGLLEAHLPRLVERHRPDVAFYLAGADPYRFDQLGGLALTMEGLRRRDEYVLRQLGQAGVPVAIVLAGGYAQRPADTVEIHCNTVRVARDHSRSIG
jgi:acetoin utilization deacetylase AcuC-like enzyme